MPTNEETPEAADPEPRRVPVVLGARSYEVLVGNGLVQDAGRHIGPLLKRPNVVIVTDETVARHHLKPLEASLAAAGIASQSIRIPSGENAKSFSQLEELLERLLALGVERSDTLIALGGGVAGDLVGFAASVLRRGVAFMQIPTTLLAQVDSSVGGKTAINARAGKNLIGTFYQPRLVLADTGTLKTLPPRELRAGYAEIAKYGLLGDAAFFAWLERHYEEVLRLDVRATAHAVATSVRAKAALVSADEREEGTRALLNLGHTFGHALEAATGYSERLLHGEGVAIGMCLAFRFSARLQLCAEGDAVRACAHLAAAGLPTRLGDIPGGALSAETLLALMQQDKKVVGGRVAFILARGIGQAFIERGVALDDVRALLRAEGAAA